MRRLLAGGLIIAAMTACIDGTDPLPLDITIEAPTTGTTADSVSIVVNAQGNSLVGVEATFGDGGQSAFPTSGAHTAKVTFRHLYTQPGTYQVTATVTDAVLGQKGASAQLSIQ